MDYFWPLFTFIPCQSFGKLRKMSWAYFKKRGMEGHFWPAFVLFLRTMIQKLTPRKRVLVLGEQQARLYIFHFGRLKTASDVPFSEVPFFRGTILLDVIPQIYHLPVFPPLSFLDRLSFFHYQLHHLFQTRHWVGYRVGREPFSSQGSQGGKRYLAAQVVWPQDPGAVPLCQTIDTLSQKKDAGLVWGSLVGELVRHRLFKQGEGLLFAPARNGKIRQIYLKNHCPVFLRFIHQEQTNFNLDHEIKMFKRYVERHYQGGKTPILSPETALAVIWWGPLPAEKKVSSSQGVSPVSRVSCFSSLVKVDLYTTHFLEDDLVRSYGLFLKPALPYFPVFPQNFLSFSFSLKGMTGVFYFLSFLFGLLCMQSFFQERRYEKALAFQKAALKEKEEKIRQTQQEIEKRKKDLEKGPWNKEAVARMYSRMTEMRLLTLPFSWMEHIARPLNGSCRLQAFFWGRGEMAFQSQTQEMTFYPVSFESFSDAKIGQQTMILDVTGPSIHDLDTLEHELKKILPFLVVDSWDSFEKKTPQHTRFSRFIHVQSLAPSQDAFGKEP